MLEEVESRGIAAAERRAAARREAIAAAISIPGVRAHVEDGSVVLEGRRLGCRLLLDPLTWWQVTEAWDER